MTATKTTKNTSSDKTASKSSKAGSSKKVTVRASRSSSSEGKVETNLIRRLTVRPRNKNIQEFGPGDSVTVFVKIKEGEKERVQAYKGIVTKLQGSGSARAFTVRKISAGIGVERTFPFASPAIDRVEVSTVGKIRRAKLYYLRSLAGKASKIQSELVTASSNHDSHKADETAAE